MPSLRQRPEDIDPNLDNDLEKFAQNYNRHVEFTEDARARYIRFATSGTISEAGRKLFSVSMGRKKSVNDADRLKKYLARFDLGWEAIKKVAQS